MSSLVSVIIPVYNAENYIRKCLDSVLAQTYTNLEIILIDDGSPDNSGKICDEYARRDERIKVIHKENGGVSSARNAGLDVAKGEYIGFVDPDDYIDSEMYEYIIGNFDDETDIVEFNFYYVYENGDKKNHDTPNIKYNCYRDVLYGMFTYNIYFGITKVYRSKVIGENRFDTNYKIAEDMLFFTECCRNAKYVKSLDKPVYYYLIRANSAVHKQLNANSFDSLEVMEKIMDDCTDKELLNAVIFYYINSCIGFLREITAQQKMLEYLQYIRKKIIKNRKLVFCSSTFPINGGVGGFTVKRKLYVLILWVCPWLAYKLHNVIK